MGGGQQMGAFGGGYGGGGHGMGGFGASPGQFHGQGYGANPAAAFGGNGGGYGGGSSGFGGGNNAWSNGGGRHDRRSIEGPARLHIKTGDIFKHGSSCTQMPFCAAFVHVFLNFSSLANLAVM